MASANRTAQNHIIDFICFILERDICLSSFGCLTAISARLRLIGARVWPAPTNGVNVSPDSPPESPASPLTRSMLRVDAPAIAVIVIANHAVTAVRVAHRAARSILLLMAARSMLLLILVRPIRVIKAPLISDNCETGDRSNDQKHSYSHSHISTRIEKRRMDNHSVSQPATHQ
jgi:hypothetical protein